MSTPDDARDADSPDQDETQDAQDSSVPAAASSDAVSLTKRGADAGKDDGNNVDKKQDKSKPAKKKAGKDPDRQSLIARFSLFLRQVMAELRKVIWPTRSELINYTVVVLVFVAIMAMILAAYDFAFARAVFFVFDS